MDFPLFPPTSLFEWIAFVVVYLLVAIALLLGGAYVFGRFFSDFVLRAESKRNAKRPRYGPIELNNTAFLIACYKGEGTIGKTVELALANNREVYVVIDGPGDRSAEIARKAGATVLELPENKGKPAALATAYLHFNLSVRYQAICILDDDVLIDPRFMRRALSYFKPETVIVVGKNVTWWPKDHRWNMWLATRAFSYWSYQLIIRRMQSWFNVMNCISGSNSVYRVEVLDKVLLKPVRYIVDDTQWVLDVHRMNLGRIVYAPRAIAHLQDPTNYRDWKKQNLRWLWGTFQGIRGHNVGRVWSRFDFAYVMLIIHWVVYVLGLPMTLVIIGMVWVHNPQFSIYFVAGYSAMNIVAAIALRRWELVALLPAIIVIDMIYRWIFVQAAYKAWREPTVKDCVWESPTRMAV